MTGTGKSGQPASDQGMPYTHWAYFSSREQAAACDVELSSQDFLVSVELSTGTIKHLPPGDQWLLLAARPVDPGNLLARHEHVEAIVERHGGFYDGGESGWIDLATGTPLRQEPPRPNPTTNDLPEGEAQQ